MVVDQKAVVQELYSRVGTLPPEKAAIVNELAGRLGISKPAQEPGLVDDVKASASFLGNEIIGASEAVDPINIAKGLIHTVLHPIDTAKGMATLPGQMYDQYQAGDMPGLAKNIGNVAGQVIAAKALPEVPGAAKTAAETLGKVADSSATPGVSLLDKIKTIADHPAAPAIAKDALKLAGGYRLAKVWDLAEKFLSRSKDEAPAASGKASTNMPVGTQTNGTVSVDAASSAMGTETPRSGFGFSGTTAPGSPFFAAAQTLDHATQVRLSQAAQSGALKSLPVAQRGELIKAVQTGDVDAIHNIMDAVEKVVPDTGQRTPQGSRVDQAVLNKAAIVVKFARDHNINLSKISEADRQTIADGAIAHAIKEGHWEQYANKTATYRGGISDASMKIINDAMSFLDGKR